MVDHSPTAILAARCTGTPCALIGTGFELPPLTTPLSSFPASPDATSERAREAEAAVLEVTNQVLRAMRAPCFEGLRDLFEVERRWLTTFAELDHYGPRLAETYVGPIGELEYTERLDWSTAGDRRVLAYLRPNTPGLPAILRALAACGGDGLC